jgi:hypothetical protein
MFQLSVVEHIRLSFGDVVRNYKAHTAAAERLARRAWQLKTTVLVQLAFSVMAAATVIVSTLRPFAITAAVLASLAFVGYAASLALDLDPRVQAHRACATRFWLLCEKYRALLTEIQDGLLDAAQVRERRDTLIREVHTVYEQAPVADREAFGLARRALTATDPMTVSDAEIDAFLPQSAHTGNPTAA